MWFDFACVALLAVFLAPASVIAALGYYALRYRGLSGQLFCLLLESIAAEAMACWLVIRFITALED